MLAEVSTFSNQIASGSIKFEIKLDNFYNDYEQAIMAMCHFPWAILFSSLLPTGVQYLQMKETSWFLVQHEGIDNLGFSTCTRNEKVCLCHRLAW